VWDTVCYFTSVTFKGIEINGYKKTRDRRQFIRPQKNEDILEEIKDPGP
jgi:hypothetical protein